MVDQLSELAFVDYVSDPLHGSIGITEREQKVIHTRIFQRLKRIKQLGTANFVYPGANHSRFEHSIGAMHVTSLILDRLKNCSRPQRRIIRLAALLHDVGHGPFSHTFEELLNRNEKYVSIYKGKELRNHEHFNRYILATNRELEKVLGPEKGRIIDFLFKRKPIGIIPSELVIGDIGSDRIDYLLRDTYYTGLGHRPDVNSLISHMKISVKERGNPRLALTAEGILSAEFLITTRYYHYSMIVHNRNTRSVELLFLRLMENFLKKKVKDPREYMFKAFTKYDDSVILSNLFHFGGPLRHRFYSGKGFHSIYDMSLREIRVGATKYCLYRFFFDRKGLMKYIRQVGTKLKKAINFDRILFDVHLFEHNVPDLILYANTYETEKEWISPLLIDHSDILKLIPSQQLLKSLICIMSKQDLDKSERRELRQRIEKARGIFLERDVLVPIVRESMTSNGFQLIDEFYTFLCALRDFYKEKPWKSEISDRSKEEQFRGIIRFYRLANECFKETKKPNLSFQEFKEKPTGFQYSTQGFSILHALASMDILRLDYVPVTGKSDGKPFHFVYIIRPVEKDITRRVYTGLPYFDKLKSRFIEVFRKLDWQEYFADFFPLKEEGK